MRAKRQMTRVRPLGRIRTDYSPGLGRTEPGGSQFNLFRRPDSQLTALERARKLERRSLCRARPGVFNESLTSIHNPGGSPVVER